MKRRFPPPTVAVTFFTPSQLCSRCASSIVISRWALMDVPSRFQRSATKYMAVESGKKVLSSCMKPITENANIPSTTTTVTKR